MIHNMLGFADPSVGKRPSAEGSMSARQEAERRGVISCRKPYFMTTGLVFFVTSLKS